MSFDKLPTWGNSGWRWGGAVCQCTSGTSSLRSWCAGIQSWCTSASQVFRLQCACMFFVCLFFCMVITIKIEQIMNFEFSIFFAGIRVTKKLWNCLYSLSLSANHLALAALSWKKIALGWFTTKDTHMGKVSNWLIVSPVLLRAQPRVMTSPLTVWDPLDFAENAVPDYERANVFYTASCTGYCFGS